MAPHVTNHRDVYAESIAKYFISNCTVNKVFLKLKDHLRVELYNF